MKALSTLTIAAFAMFMVSCGGNANAPKESAEDEVVVTEVTSDCCNGEKEGECCGNEECCAEGTEVAEAAE